MNHTQKPELLCPAGDYESLQAAVRYGADAVYLAGRAFGMRSASRNFDRDELARAVEFAHADGAAVHVTCNIVPRNGEMELLPEYFGFLRELGVDALIISDLGTMALAKKYAPGIPIHMSVQTGICNYESAKECFRLGAGRVVLARELSLREIAEIRRRTPAELELEAFVHGSICVSFSGRCLLSNYMTGRDANHGDCAQPCRWAYSLVEKKRPGEEYTVYEEEEGTYILNAKDLNLIEYLPQLAEAGISSFKIEGRAKSAYYTAVTANAYRAALDGMAGQEEYHPPRWALEELNRISHRPYSTGFYFERPQNGQYYENSGYIREYDVAACVTGWENGRLFLSQRNKFCEGDRVELVRPHKPPEEIRAEDMRDEEGESISSAPHATMPLSIRCDIPAEEGAFLRKKRSES